VGQRVDFLEYYAWLPYALALRSGNSSQRRKMPLATYLFPRQSMFNHIQLQLDVGSCLVPRIDCQKQPN
jgi:hypothetical protein